jgi:hypothetical protein
MTRLCFNMNLLKKFEMPDDFNEKFHSSIMRDTPKDVLDMYKYKRANSANMRKSSKY